LTRRFIYTLFFSLLFAAFPLSHLWAQVVKDTTTKLLDTSAVKTVIDTAGSTAKDTMAVKVVRGRDSAWFNHSPRRAAIRSAIIPGWGQVYNKQVWKVPIVYGALGTTAAIFVYNIKNYRDFRFAYQAKYKASTPPPGSPAGTPPDSTDFRKLSEKFKNPNWDLVNLRLYRNEFRKNIDYSVLVFILFWGLNVADAAAAAHLRTFDVSPELSLQIKPGRSYMGGTNGLSLILAFK
jgi:hypothetical protein